MSNHYFECKNTGGWEQLWCVSCGKKLDSQQPGNAAAWMRLRVIWSELAQEHAGITKEMAHDMIDWLIEGYPERAREVYDEP